MSPDPKLGTGWLTQERDRIGRFADAYNIPRDYVFQGGRPAPQAPVIASSQAMMAPTGQGGPAPRVASAPSSLLSQAQAAPVATGQPATKGPAPNLARIDMYAQLPPDALERQAQEMKAFPDKYSAAEKAAAAIAWQRVFGGGQ